MIQKTRVKALNGKQVTKGKCVVYWMQQSQRSEYNHALEYAIRSANDLGLPVVVFFGLTDRFPEANERHYHFMLEGLREVGTALGRRGMKMVVRHEPPETGIVKLAKDAALVVVDRGYLRIQRLWRRKAAKSLRCPLVQVESDVVVPVEEVSAKEEYAAATIRPKIARHVKQYLVPLRPTRPRKQSLGLRLPSLDLDRPERICADLRIDRSVGRVRFFKGGTAEAKRHLRRFIRHRLDRFGDLRNDPSLEYLSNLSPYLHFGQISPIYVALEARKSGSPGVDAFLEELIVRRELSMNLVLYNRHYDTFKALPAWATATLKAHHNDRREYTYTRRQLENARTHDPYWNAAQNEMRLTGKMHGYMRMYWGKKIIEWTRTPEQAYRIALYLNNKYELDGRDPNAFAGVAWCFGKHDRPWGERKIFGKVRYMNDAGLRRKFDVDAYVARVDSLSQLETYRAGRGEK
jgi:deoxyribodipyrimidine photo-lyase